MRKECGAKAQAKCSVQRGGIPQLRFHRVEEPDLEAAGLFCYAVEPGWLVKHPASTSVAQGDPEALPGSLPLCEGVAQSAEPSAVRCYEVGRPEAKAWDSSQAMKPRGQKYLQENLLVQATISTAGNVERVAMGWLRNGSPTPLKDGTYLKDLDSLRTTIEAASYATVSDPESECRQSMKLLAGLAAGTGPMGDAAREELCDLYLNPPEQMSSEVRDHLLNSALEVCVAWVGESQKELAATLVVMAAAAPEAPTGQNGDGCRQLMCDALHQVLPREFERDPNLLAKDRVVTNTERQAAGAQLKNLNWGARASIATTEAAKSSFERMLGDVAVQQKTVTVWVADASGRCVPVVAQPTFGGIRFHVIAQDEAGNQVGKHLEELSGADCVITHRVDDDLIALRHLDENFHDERGAGGVLREHTDHWSGMSSANQDAAKLVSRGQTLQAVAESRRAGVSQEPTASAEVALPSPAQRPKSLEDNFNKQGLTNAGSGRLHSAFDGMVEAVSLNVPFADRTLSPEDQVKLELKTPYSTRTKFTRSAPETGNFYKSALAFAEDFNERRAPLLFQKVESQHPLASVSKTLRDFRSGEDVVKLTVDYQQKLLQRCYDGSTSNDLSSLKTALDEVVELQTKLLANTDNAIAELEKLNSADLGLSTPALTAQARAEAKVLIAALKQYRECLTGENSAEGNVYADFVAFAKQATKFGRSLEAAQAMFRGIGSITRTVPTPAAALQPPPPEIVVRLPAASDVPSPMQADQAPPPLSSNPVPHIAPVAPMAAEVPESPAAMPQATRLELKAMASAGGFVRDKITEQPTNVWFDIADTMNVHMALSPQKGVMAGFLGRRRLSDDVERRLNEMPDSNKRLTTAVMMAGPVPLSLDKSPLWAHLDKARDAGAERVYVSQNAILEGADVSGLAQPLLTGKGQALVAISAQVLARLAVLSTEITKCAALVTSKDPNDQNHRLFKKSLLELQSWLGREEAKIDTAISELDAVLAPKAKDVTYRMRADANTLRKALIALQIEFKDPAGVVQQAIGFARVSLASPENLQQAADALIV